MLWRWNLPGLCIFMRPFIWHNIWALPLGRKRAWSKNLWKKAKKSVFAPNFDQFFKIQQKLSNIWCVTLHCISGKTFKQIWPNFMGLYPRNQKTDLQSHFCYHYLNSIEKKKFFFEITPIQQTEYYFINYWWSNTIPKYFLLSFNLSHFRSSFCHWTTRDLLTVFFSNEERCLPDNEYFWNGGTWKVAKPDFYSLFMKVIFYLCISILEILKSFSFFFCCIYEWSW